MDSKREKELQEEIDKALKHEEIVQHDENEKPVTFAKKIDEKLE
jgi:hypothetical protein